MRQQPEDFTSEGCWQARGTTERMRRSRLGRMWRGGGCCAQAVRVGLKGAVRSGLRGCCAGHYSGQTWRRGQNILHSDRERVGAFNDCSPVTAIAKQSKSLRSERVGAFETAFLTISFLSLPDLAGTRSDREHDEGFRRVLRSNRFQKTALTKQTWWSVPKKFRNRNIARSLGFTAPTARTARAARTGRAWRGRRSCSTVGPSCRPAAPTGAC